LPLGGHRVFHRTLRGRISLQEGTRHPVVTPGQDHVFARNLSDRVDAPSPAGAIVASPQRALERNPVIKTKIKHGRNPEQIRSLEIQPPRPSPSPTSATKPASPPCQHSATPICSHAVSGHYAMIRSIRPSASSAKAPRDFSSFPVTSPSLAHRNRSRTDLSLGPFDLLGRASELIRPTQALAEEARGTQFPLS